MELRDLSHEERLALVALLEVVLESDRAVSDGEVADIDQVVGELGREEYERLVVEVDQRFPTEDELRVFLPSITRQDARELIYGTVLDTAIEDAVDARESADPRLALGALEGARRGAGRTRRGVTSGTVPLTGASRPVTMDGSMSERRADVRNIAIIAHVDHGKTTLVDAMLRQTGVFRANEQVVGSRHGLERARARARHHHPREEHDRRAGRACSINIVDTPGHADFGGEVERTLAMVDGVLLLVDASEGPLPQTRFVLGKALEAGLEPVVCLNKIDRADARPAEVLDEIYGLFIDLGANEQQLDFPVDLHQRARRHRDRATSRRRAPTSGRSSRRIVATLPGPAHDPDAPTQFQANNLDYDDYVGRLAIGRVRAGRASIAGGQYTLCRADGAQSPCKMTRALRLARAEARRDRARDAGDIVAIAGIEEIDIGDTIADRERPAAAAAHPRRRADHRHDLRRQHEPVGGPRGQPRHVAPAPRAALPGEPAERQHPRRGDRGRRTRSACSGRGELQLAILIETMRREGYELQVSKPTVVVRERDGVGRGADRAAARRRARGLRRRRDAAPRRPARRHDEDGPRRRRPRAPRVRACRRAA